MQMNQIRTIKKNSIENKENKKQKNRRLHTYWLKLFKCGLPFQTLKSSIFFSSFLFAQHSVLFICYTLHTEKSFCILCLFPVSLGIRIITFNAQGNNDAAKKLFLTLFFHFLSFFSLSQNMNGIENRTNKECKLKKSIFKIVLFCRVESMKTPWKHVEKAFIQTK